jgi:hypothetical protein
MAVTVAVTMPMVMLVVMARCVIVRIVRGWAVMMAVTGHAIPPFR